MAKKTLSDQAYEAMKMAIMTCELKPGEQIPQNDLMEQYGTSATPIREALMRLVQEGLVETIPRFGYIVSHVTLSDIHEIYELRLALESAAARLAATKATEAQLHEISENAHFTYVFGDRKSYFDFLNQNTEFHLLVAHISANGRLARQISNVLDELMRVFHLGLDLRDSAEEMRDEHIALAAALSARDGNKAQEVVTAQINTSLERVMQALTQKNGFRSENSPLGSVHIHR